MRARGSRVSLSAAVLVAAVLSLPATGRGQTDDTPDVRSLDGARPAPATIEDVAWIAGSWVGTGFGGTIHEVWSGPVSGTMLGMYRHDIDGVPNFYELQLLVEEEGTLMWKVKHFDADFTGWEEKDDYMTFPLVELADGVAYFDGLTARRVGPDGLVIQIRTRSGDGLREETLRYQRAPLTGGH